MYGWDGMGVELLRSAFNIDYCCSVMRSRNCAATYGNQCIYQSPFWVVCKCLANVCQCIPLIAALQLCYTSNGAPHPTHRQVQCVVQRLTQLVTS